MYPYKIGTISIKNEQISFTRQYYTKSRVPVLNAHTIYEVLLIRSGEFTAVCGTSFHTGDAPCLVFYNKGCYHGTARYYCETVPYDAYSTYFDDRALEAVSSIDSSFSDLFLEDFWALPLSEAEADHIVEILQSATNIHDDYPSKFGYLIIYFSYIRKILEERNFAPHHIFGEVYILEAIRHILYETEKGIQTKVADLPKKFCVCASKFLKDFKAVTGVSAKEYIEICALDRSKRLLAKGYGIAEAAEACGFSSTSYFIQFFGRQVGMTPGVYKKQIRDGINKSISNATNKERKGNDDE